jgi:hypothetical protein
MEDNERKLKIMLEEEGIVFLDSKDSGEREVDCVA